MTTDNQAVDDGLPEHLAHLRPMYEALSPADRPAQVARWLALIDLARQRSAAALRLQARFGSALEREWARDPNGPRLSAQEVMAVTCGASYRGSADDRPRPTAGDLVDALRQVEQARLDLAMLEERLVELARTEADDRRRLPWAEIADALELGSAQAAQQRYRHSSRTRLRTDIEAVLIDGEAGSGE